MATGIKIATATDERLLRQLVLLNTLQYNKMSEEPQVAGGQGQELSMEPADVAAAAASEVK